MDILNLTGSWTGVIIYGNKYRKFSGRDLIFEAEFTQIADQFSGVSVDIKGFGVNPDPATISGTVSERSISFTKRYNTNCYIDRSGNAVSDPSLSNLDIYYTGSYYPDKGIFTGTWEYRVPYKFLGFIPFLHRPGGSWSMTRK
jgi:hypothetical protein